jgi:HSP20 family protein
MHGVIESPDRKAAVPSVSTGLEKEVAIMALIRRKENDRALARGREWDPFEIMQDLLRWDPVRELSQSFGGEMTFAPSFEVKETNDSYVFKTDLPGVKEEDLDISLTGNRLSISGQRQEEQRKEGDRYYAYERRYGSFSRSFTLPEGIDQENVRADLKDGVLTVVVSKKPEVQPRRIQLKGGQSDNNDQPTANN